MKSLMILLSLMSVPPSSAEEAELKKIELPKLKKVEKAQVSTSLSSMKLENLKTMKLELVAPNLPPLPAVAPVPAVAEPPRQLPKWERVEFNKNFRLFPVMSDGSKIYVSMYGGYGDEISFSSETEIKVKDAYYARTLKDSSSIEGALVQEVLKEAKISQEETVFWFLFAAPKEEKKEIKSVKSLVIYPNEAGDGIFGTIGIHLGSAPSGTKNGSVVGLAFIGKNNLLLPSKAHSPDWKSIGLDVPSEKALAHVNASNPVSPPDVREVSQPLKFQAAKLGAFELIEAKAEFKHKLPDQAPNPTEHLIGYFIRGNGDTKSLFDFYLDGVYSQAPEQVVVGNWIKGYDGTLYISSTGMGDCGIFLLVKNGAKPVAIPVRCGSWGC